MIWFPFYSSDFIGATVGLSCQEVSIYNWMLTLYYELGPFPPDHVRTYRIVRCESDEQKRTVDFLLQNFFVLREDGWYQERAEEVKVSVAQNSERARQKANKRWSAAPQDAAALPEHSKSNAGAMLATSTSISTSTSKDKPCIDTDVSMSSSSFGDDQEVAVGSQKKTAYKVPDCPYKILVDLYHEHLPSLPRAENLTENRKRHIHARWRQVCADEKLDRDAGIAWFTKFYKHISSSKFLLGKVQSTNGRGPFMASLDWIMSPEKFVLIVEGKYHR